jgi:hypothetical protein
VVIIYNTLPAVLSYSGVMCVKVLFVMVEVINHIALEISLRIEGIEHYNRRKQTQHKEKVQKKKNKKPP